MRELLVIVPSRGRPESVEELATAFQNTSIGASDLLFATDDDEPPYPESPGVLYERGPRLRMCGTLNTVAKKYASKYEYIGFMGDDHRPRTAGWDYDIIDALRSYKIAYGNDLLQSENLPTAVFMRSEIIKRVSYMAPPELIHLFMDNVWLEWGKATSIKYLPEVIIEHMHPAAGKAEWTEQYQTVNSQEMREHDEKAFEKYMKSKFKKDVVKIIGRV